jgi:hypothetical protein
MNISRYLRTSAELAAVTEHAERLISLQLLFEAIAPPALAQHCRVANFKQGILVILAANNLLAAKLRQVLPSLADEFCYRGWKVTSIQVAVQDREKVLQMADSSPISPPAPLDPDTRARLQAFAQHAADPKVRGAVERLLQVAGPKAGESTLPPKTKDG